MGIPAEIQQQIIENIAKLEHERTIQILFACESGSRAWGFASENSDYDVRFIYIHEKDWYLSVFPKKDTIDLMLPNDLDLCGWDLRKALSLLSKSNISLMEWFGSPIVYHANATFVNVLSSAAQKYFNPIKGFHHYWSMCKNFEEYIKPTDVNSKKLFYHLRAMLACAWICQRDSMPPTEFVKLRTLDWLTSVQQNWIDSWLIEKSAIKEQDTILLTTEQSTWLRQSAEKLNLFSTSVSDRKYRDYDRLDKLLLQFLR